MFARAKCGKKLPSLQVVYCPECGKDISAYYLVDKAEQKNNDSKAETYDNIDFLDDEETDNLPIWGHSKYDPILESFLKGPYELVKVEVPERDADYLKTQLGKRIIALKLEEAIEISVVNGVTYLEKLSTTPKKKKRGLFF
jgi:hypothetical protein